MASNILIKRSTGATAPGSITYGELAVTIGGNGTQANPDDRLFVGDNNGAAQIVGGKYFTDMLDHVAGTLTGSSAVIVDSNSKVDFDITIWFALAWEHNLEAKLTLSPITV